MPPFLSLPTMIQFLKSLFSSGEKKSISQLLEEGATIVDVRTPAEFKAGHLKQSINIPLDQLKAQLNKVDKDKPVITCCASGMRSASAKRIFKANGYEEVVNGGGWTSLQQYFR